MILRPFYTYYVAHIIRQYFAKIQPTNPTKAYTRNLECAAKVITALPERDQNILRDLYYNFGRMSMTAKAEIAAERYHVEKTEVWNLLSETERKIAQERELI